MKEQLELSSKKTQEMKNVLKMANIPEEEHPNFDVNAEVANYYLMRHEIASLRY